MEDDTKIWLALIGLAAIFIVGGGVLIYASERDRAVLRQAACQVPESAACALAVRR